MGSYDDIINLPHHVSTSRPQMSLINRAAQFAPFAALTGYGAAIKETARLTDKRIQLDENLIAELDIKLQMLADIISDHPEIAVTYFQPDKNKDGGKYVTSSGSIKKIDEFERIIVMNNGTKISFEQIIEIVSDLFKEPL